MPKVLMGELELCLCLGRPLTTLSDTFGLCRGAGREGQTSKEGCLSWDSCVSLCNAQWVQFFRLLSSFLFISLLRSGSFS